MARPTCQHCTTTARYRVTGANLRAPRDTCEGCLDVVQRGAGVPRTTVLIEDDGQDALFDIGGAA